MSRGELFILMSLRDGNRCGNGDGALCEHPVEGDSDAFGHILIASIISTPAAIAISVLMVSGEGIHTRESSHIRLRPRAWTR